MGCERSKKQNIKKNHKLVSNIGLWGIGPSNEPSFGEWLVLAESKCWSTLFAVEDPMSSVHDIASIVLAI